MFGPTLKRQTSRGTEVHYSVIIPAYNEESLLAKTLAGLQLAMDAIPYQGEVIVVDNNSSDNTLDFLLSQKNTHVYSSKETIQKK